MEAEVVILGHTVVKALNLLLGTQVQADILAAVAVQVKALVQDNLGRWQKKF